MLHPNLRTLLAGVTVLFLSASLKGQSEGTLKWAFQWVSGTVFVSSPAVGADGTVYIGSESASPSQSRVFALDPATGSMKWSYQVPDWIDGSPAVAADGTIYVGCWDGNLYALRPSGSLKWAYETGNFIYSSPAIGLDGTIYVGSGDGDLHAIDPDGTPKWTFPTGDWVDSSPAVGPDGTVYVGSWDNSVYAVSAGGNLLWSHPTDGPVVSSPAIGGDGRIYVGSDDGFLYALNQEGGLEWRFETGDAVESSPAIGIDGTIYVGSLDGYLYAVNPDGTARWAYFLNYAIVSSPAVRSDGSVVVGTGDNSILCVSSAGDLLWAYTTGDWVDSSPAIAADGTIYAGSFDNFVYALNGNQPLADTAWPKFRLDAKNTAAVKVSSPEILVQPFSLVAAPGDRVILQVIPLDSSGTSYQWQLNGSPIPGQTEAILDLGDVQSSDAGIYRVLLMNSAGEGLSNPATLQVVAGADSRLSNIATRGEVVGDSQIMIPGFVIEGSGDLPVLIRGVGPTLQSLIGVGNPDPLLEVLDKDGEVLAVNDRWGNAPNLAELELATDLVGAFPLDPGSEDAAVLRSLPAGRYTAKVSGVDGAQGISLAEVFEVADAATPARLVNIATRGRVGIGAAIMIPGFVIDGTAAKAVLIRGVGPSLEQYGVNDFLENPRLVLYSNSGEIINANDDWEEAPNAVAVATAAATVGAFPLEPGSSDAAILTVLPPGQYTALVEGADGGVGTGLVEVYRLP